MYRIILGAALILNIIILLIINTPASSNDTNPQSKWYIKQSDEIALQLKMININLNKINKNLIISNCLQANFTNTQCNLINKGD